MKKEVFESLVKNNGIIIKVNQNNEKLVTKEQFIDDLLTRECVDNIAECLQELKDIKAEYQTEWSMVRFYCSAIKGLNDAMFLERVAMQNTQTRECNYERLEQLQQQKIQYISDFANYLYK